MNSATADHSLTSDPSRKRPRANRVVVENITSVPENSHRPRRAPIRRRVLAARMTIVTFALAMTVASSAVATSGAFFTDGKVTAGNTATAALVKIGGTGPDATPTALVAATNILPLSDADAADNTKGVFVPLVVRNVGTTAMDWSLGIINASSTFPAFPASILVRVSVDNGVTYGATQTLAAMTTITGTGLLAAVSPATSTVRIVLRLWLDKGAANSSQGAVTTMSIETKAIQSGVPMTTGGVTYPQ